jgi:hypothetical protein
LFGVEMTMIKTIPALTNHDLRRAERLYARSCIFTSWIICALLTAVFAWTLRQHPFSFPPLAIQLSALTVNGLCWWLCTTQIWFKLESRRMSAATRFERSLKRLRVALLERDQQHGPAKAGLGSSFPVNRATAKN